MAIKPRRPYVRVLAALFIVACSSNPTSGSSSFDVGLVEWQITLDAGDIASGRTAMHVANVGVLQHELVLIRVADDEPHLSTTNGVADISSVGDGLVGELADLSPATDAAISVDLEPGRYLLICNIPGHYDAGMHVTFDVAGDDDSRT